MSYDEDKREPFSSPCACGKGYLKYYKVYESNDWGTERDYTTPVEIICDYCESNYYYKKIYGEDYLVPNRLTFPKETPSLNKKYRYSSDEAFVTKHTKDEILNMIADMTAQGHRFIKDLTYLPAIKYANNWAFYTKKRSLSPMVTYLKRIQQEYDSLKESVDKRPYVDQHQQKCNDENQKIIEIENQSIKLDFEYTPDLDKGERDKIRRTQNTPNDFYVLVHYDESFKKDFTNLYWDSYHIEECIDPQYLSFNKSDLGSPSIVIAKKYRCVCTICGKKAELLSSDMKVLFNEENGYFLKTCCDCHKVSSFEAKTMDILNNLGVTYIREKSFDGLKGDNNGLLRFDFALSKSGTNVLNPNIDLIIELQGPHHYNEGFYDEYGEYITECNSQRTQIDICNNFERQKRYDTRKADYCKAHGINFECIKYTASANIDKLEEKIKMILRENQYI